MVQVPPFTEALGLVDAGLDRAGGSDQGVGDYSNAQGVLAAGHDLPYRSVNERTVQLEHCTIVGASRINMVNKMHFNPAPSLLFFAYRIPP